MARKSSKSAELLAQPDPRAPLDVGQFLAVAQRVLDRLTEDLLARADESPAITEALKARHRHEKSKQLTADAYPQWRRAIVVQVAAAWLLSCVFVRTLEDRGLLARNRLAGPGAMDAQQAFLQLAPHLGLREYLLTIFTELDHFSAVKRLFDRDHNLAWRLAPSPEGAKALVDLFRGPDPEQPHFRFGQPSTRFLGDLYQDLSEEVRKRYALWQTPHFIETFILDRTLEPAIAEFGLRETNIIDPTCGSGHFLLGAFDRLFDHWSTLEPGASDAEHVERALASVFGVDVNPYAAFIAQFRLMLAALGKLRVARIAEAPELHMNVVVADSLLENELGQLPGVTGEEWGKFNFIDGERAKAMLRRRYTVVVGNPPYIPEKDTARRESYRKAYESAAGKYALSAPYVERFFLLARRGGFVGQITSNSFMKREFGKALVQQVLPRLDLQTIINTSGVPGHGTPTVMLFGRNRPPEEKLVHTVLARRGEPTTPEDPAKGLVWSSIRDHWAEIGYEDEYVTVAAVEREQLGVHPWSLEGGGAGELKDWLETRAHARLGGVADSIGIVSFTLEDDVYLRDASDWTRIGMPSNRMRAMATGEMLRDWVFESDLTAFFPYNDDFTPIASEDPCLRLLWPYRTNLSNSLLFGGKTKVQGGLAWFEYGRLTSNKLATPLSITFAFVATHNHFVLDRGGKVFKQTAPIIKLPESATEDDHLALLAYLNSSTACFWMKQVCFDKGATVEKNSERAKTAYEFSSTQLASFPMVPRPEFRDPLIALAREISQLADARGRLVEECLPLGATNIDVDQLTKSIAKAALDDVAVLDRMVFLQEELDWLVYEAWDLAPPTTDAITSLAHTESRLSVGLRPSEVFAARRGTHHGVDGQVLYETIPPSVSERVRALVEKRVELIAGDERLRLLEDAQYKRRWWIPRVELGAGRGETLADRVRRHCDMWLRTRIERLAESTGTTFSVRELVRRADADVSIAAVVEQLEASARAGFVASVFLTESVPFIAAFRFTDRGLEKHAAWQHTWALQRREDAGEKVGDIPVPPKYDQKDFRDATGWRLRGKLDVPKERFIAYPGCESDKDKEPIYGWAGWNHAQRAEVLLALYTDRKSNEGWGTDRLTPILAGVHELIPWLEQWHNEPDDETGERLGDAYEDWLGEELRAHGLTRADLDAWRPVKKTAAKQARKPASVHDEEPKPAKKVARKRASKKNPQANEP